MGIPPSPKYKAPTGAPIKKWRKFCLELPGVEETFPFYPECPVMKVGGKVFAIFANREDIAGMSVNLKCDPDLAIALRDNHAEVLPGYHMNKKHWNTVALGGKLKAAEIKQMFMHSYDLILGKGKVKKKEVKGRNA